MKPITVISYFLFLLSLFVVSCQIPVQPIDSAIQAAPTQTPAEEAAAAPPAESTVAAAEVAASEPTTVPVEEPVVEPTAIPVEEATVALAPVQSTQSVPPPLTVSTLSSIGEVEWSTNGEWLAVAGTLNGSQGSLSVYRMADLSAPVWQANSALANGPTSLAFGGNDQFLAAVNSSNGVEVWDVNSGAVAASFAFGELSGARSVAFSPTGDRLAIGGAAGSGGVIKLVDFASRGELATMPYDQPFMNLSFHPSGNFLSGSVGNSCGPGPAFSWTLDLNGDLTNFDWRRDVEIQHAKQVAASRSKMLTVGAYGPRCQFYNGDIQLVDTATESITGNVTRLAPTVTAHFSADGSAFTMDDGVRLEAWRDGPLRRVNILDAAVGKPMAISPNGDLVAQVNGNQITFVGTGGPNAAAIAIAEDAPLRNLERFTDLAPETVAARYRRMEIPDGLLSITKASQTDPAILTFVVDQAAIDKYLMAVHDFETVENWQGIRHIEIDVRNGAEPSPLMIQLRERHADGRQGDSWRGSRMVPPFSEMTVSLMLEPSKGFNQIPSAPPGDGVMDLGEIGTIELGVTSHHIMRGEMEILAIRLFD